MRKIDSHIMIVDDDEDVLFAARLYLKRFFSKVRILSSPKALMQELNQEVIDVILLDLNYRKGVSDGREGLYWLNHINEHSPETVVVMMTAFSDVTVAVESLKSGAFDFVLKPWKNEKLLATIQAAVKLNRSRSKAARFDRLHKDSSENEESFVVGESDAIQEVMNVVEKVAATEANVLLLGENGTGKFVIAEEIHRRSHRKDQAFVHVDLGSLSPQLIESELFGHGKGAYTDAKESSMGRFELADGGTIFLDEIGNLPVELQSKLLSVLQERKVVRLGEAKERPIDVRIICATNVNIPEAINEKLFRQDLYYRINTVEIRLPALRERMEDLASFFNFFLKKYEGKYSKDRMNYDEALLEHLKSHSWPGNIRELQHAVERAVIMAEGGKITESDFSFNAEERTPTSSNLNLEEMEKQYIKSAMKKYKGNITQAAKELGLTRAALYRRLEKFEL